MENLSEESSLDTATHKAIAKIHGKFIFSRRVRRLAQAIHSLIDPDSRLVLDVGSGSGEVALRLQQLAPLRTFSGLDVLVRDKTAIPTKLFDGLKIPYPDASFDVVLLVDVLHHSKEPETLLSECARVARRAVIIKDHNSENRFDQAVLRFMDWIGNASHGVWLEYNYFSAKQWRNLFAKISLHPNKNDHPHKPLPVSLLTAF